MQAQTRTGVRPGAAGSDPRSRRRRDGFAAVQLIWIKTWVDRLLTGDREGPKLSLTCTLQGRLKPMDTQTT